MSYQAEAKMGIIVKIAHYLEDGSVSYNGVYAMKCGPGWMVKWGAKTWYCVGLYSAAATVHALGGAR